MSRWIYLGGFTGFGASIVFLFIIVVMIAIGYGIYRSLGFGGYWRRNDYYSSEEKETTFQRLRERYANGDISKEQFDQMKKNLRPYPEQEETALWRLRERYADGEITKEQFEQMQKDLLFYPNKGDDFAFELLRIRYANGEITKEEFEQIQKDLMPNTEEKHPV